MTDKLKHWLIAVLIVFLAGTGFAWFRAHEAWKDKERDVAVQEAKQATMQQALAQIESERKQQRAELAALASRPATVQTVTKLVPVPGKVEIQPVGPNQTPTLTFTGDPQANLQALQNMAIKCKGDEIDLNACQAREQQKDGLIASLTKERDDLKTLAIPRWTLTAAVSKAQMGSYKPAALLDYRIAKTWGLTVGAANNSLIAGVSIHFGGTAKPK